MPDDSARKETKSVDSHPVTAKNEKQAAERRWFLDILEDDEVREALALRRAQEKTQGKAKGND